MLSDGNRLRSQDLKREKKKVDVQQDEFITEFVRRDGENIARQPWDLELSTLNYHILSVMPNKIKIYHGWKQT